MTEGSRGSPLHAFTVVFANPALRRVQLSWLGSIVGQVALGVGIAVYAYGIGGAPAVGLVYVLRLAPAAVVTPFTSMLGDRFPRERVMLGANGFRLILAGAATFAVAAHVRHWGIYALAIAISIAGTPFRPAQAALLPSLAERPEELTSANVVASTIEGLGFFAGPALAGVLLSVASPTAVFALSTVAFAWSVVVLARPLPSRGAPAGHESTTGEPFLQELLGGVRTIVRRSDLRALVAMFGAQTLVCGAANVLVVVTAIKLLDLGRQGVGYLDAATGVGGLIGAVLAASLAGRNRLTPPFLAGILLWGLPLAAIAAWPTYGVGLVAMGALGIGNLLVDVAGFTLLQRAVDDAVLARVFGALEAMFYGTVALGALITPPLIHGIGIRWTLAATGLFLPVLTIALGPKLLTIDRKAPAPVTEVALLRAIPIFAPLPPIALERLALQLSAVLAPAGSEIIRQGDPGDLWYLLVSGAADVLVDGERRSTLSPGEGFGEIALLRDVPRTATVVATQASRLATLDRETFLAAVGADERATAAANDLVGRRLAS